jgi:hypothetical protein
MQISNSTGKKRARSPSDSDSLSDSPPPPKRKQSSAKNDISSEIWKLFGKDRDRYVNADVYSDEDDDMEADADALRKEELRRYVYPLTSYEHIMNMHTAHASLRGKMSWPRRKSDVTRKRNAVARKNAKCARSADKATVVAIMGVYLHRRNFALIGTSARPATQRLFAAVLFA